MGILSAKLSGEPTATHDSVRTNCYVTSAKPSLYRSMHGKSTLEMNNHAQPTLYAGASKRSSPTASFKGSCLNHEALTARPSAFAAARCSKSAFGATSAEGLRAVALPASRLYRTSTSHGAREGGQLALWDTPVRPRDLLPSYSRK